MGRTHGAQTVRPAQPPRRPVMWGHLGCGPLQLPGLGLPTHGASLPPPPPPCPFHLCPPGSGQTASPPLAGDQETAAGTRAGMGGMKMAACYPRRSINAGQVVWLPASDLGCRQLAARGDGATLRPRASSDLAPQPGQRLCLLSPGLLPSLPPSC